MSLKEPHHFDGSLRWTGAAAEAAGGRLELGRDYVIEFAGKAPLPGSAPAVFRGDDSRHNPESLMVSSLMACHVLTYVALCERAGIRIVEYVDAARGTLAVRDGRMRMVEVLLRPRVRIAQPESLEQARALHAKAHAGCFMSNSVNFEVRVEAAVTA
jgi:organic hydroperoxide reductase OsmC/OhrA